MSPTFSTLKPLLPSEVHVWLSRTDGPGCAEQAERFHRLLSAEERDRCARYVFDRDRNLYLMARAQLRVLLSLYGGAEPGEWRFRENDFGRPEIAHPATPEALFFNVSHTPGLIAYVLSRDPEVGVDVEDTTREAGMLDIAKANFTAQERAELAILQGAALRRRFFELWTLKEAYVKARGRGLSIDIAGVGFATDQRGEPSLCTRPQHEDAPQGWQFASFRPTERHQVALAVRCRHGRREIRLIEATKVES